MNYFEMLDTITIDGTKKMRNIFMKHYFINFRDDQLMHYNVKDGDTIEKLAFDLYGSTEYWWIIALVNNFSDINFDFPATDEVIQMAARDEATVNGVLDMDSYVTIYERIQKCNDKKRKIKIVRPEHLKEVLATVVKKLNE